MIRRGIRRAMTSTGDPNLERDDLLEATPLRWARAFREMTSGYEQDPERILERTFNANGYDEMIAVPGISFASLCEHHLLPFVGTAVVAYIPGPRVVGLSKIPRLVECFARRLQIQERMTTEIASTLHKSLEAKGTGVIISASHTCMTIRGIQKPGARMVTSALHGAMREDPRARAEFLALADARLET